MTAREVLLEGGAPWGFRMHGGVDANQQLRISRVNPGSKAAQRGIREGDLISSINDQSTKDLTNLEAHGLLRKAGDVLKLGLNEETSGSPKRRQYRTIHQETLQETVKRSSITTYSVKKTVETVESQQDKNNDNSVTKPESCFRVNGTSKSSPQTDNVVVTRKSPLPSSSSNPSSPTSIKEGNYRYTPTDFAEASPRSSYTNCTLSPSSPSILSEDGRSDPNQLNDDQIEQGNMNDNQNQSSSRSQKRRQRRRNKKTHGNTLSNCDNEIVLESSKIIQEEYLVHSPAELVEKLAKGKPVKSRSLDDDDMVKIQEVSETSETEEKEKDTQAIVSEASESEVEWEETLSLATTAPTLHGTLSTLTLPLEGYSTEQVTLISPEEEKSLRNFLEGLNLVNGPEEAVCQIYERNAIESIKQRKARKRAALEQYFTPICQNPRYLDAISEEVSDKDSDKEQISLTRHLKQGTPELEIPPKIPPRLNRHRRQALPPKFAAPVEQAPAILVDAKILENQAISEGYYSTVRSEEASASSVEVVFLSSSGTTSPEELQSGSSDSYDLEAEEANEASESKTESYETHNEQLFNTIRKDSLDEKCQVQEMSGSNESTRSTSSNHYSFTIKTDKEFECTQTNFDNGLSSQLTPPPTPENLSPKYRHIVISKSDEPLVLDQGPDMEAHYTRFVNEDLNTEPVDNKITSDPTIKSCEIYMNVVTPPPPSRSSSSSRSSSRDSSLCTARYNPSTSSIIEVLSREEDEITYIQPLTLREICLKFLLTLPHGQEVLQELAEVSKQIDSYTRSLPVTILPQIVHNTAHYPTTTSSDVNNVSYNLSVQISQKHSTKEENISQDQDNIHFEIPRTSEKVLEEGCRGRERVGNEKPDRSWLGRNSSEQSEDLSHIQNLNNKVFVSVNEVKEERLKKEKQSQVHTSFPNNHKVLREGEENIPITIEKAGRENQLNIERNIPCTIEEADNKVQLNTERNIPISIEKAGSEGQLKVERNIPISIEKSLPEHPLEVWRDIPITIEKVVPKSKEVVIPIQKEWTNQGGKEECTHPSSKTVENNMNSLTDVRIPIRREWFGATSENPSISFSKRTKEQEISKDSDQASKLLELHEKYVNKELCHHEVKQIEENKVTITNATNPVCNRLLTIIKEEPSVITEDSNYLYFVEKEPKIISTLPKEKARLNAKDLTEWLSLARAKSMSESNLSSISTIPENNLRSYFDLQSIPVVPRRRTSLPHDLFEKQMLYIQEKEREIQRQLEELEEEKRMLSIDLEPPREFRAEDYYFSQKGDFARKRHSMPAIPTEIFRRQMYEEYMNKFAEREERKQHKVIKVTSSKDPNLDGEKVGHREIIHTVLLEDEFMDKVKQKQKEGKLEKVKSLEGDGGVAPVEEGEPVLVIDGKKLKEAKELPKHLQEFVGADGIWSPGQKLDSPRELHQRERDSQKTLQDESIPPVWIPKSASSSPTVERKEFKSVNFQSPVLGRKTRTKSENLETESPSSAPPWRISDYSSDTGLAPTSSDRRIPTSYSSPASGFTEHSVTTRLPKAQNPTITLLQKAREGQLPRGAHYIEQDQRQYRPKNDRPPIAGPGDVLYQIKNEYTSESESENPRRMADLGPRKFEGIGPVSKDGMPLILRSELKDKNQSKWYKRMYDTIHKQKPHSDEYITVRYKQKRAQYPYTSGYLSEPEPGAYDSDFTDYKHQTLDRRRPTVPEKTPYVTSTMPRSSTQRPSSSDILRSSQNYYKNQPGRIENYTPGHSSISEREAKEHLEQQKRVQSHPKSFINQALKESGYESDSTLVFRRKEEAALQLNPREQREAYKVIQKGGDVPLKGLRKLAPERPKETDFVEFYPISPTLTRIRIHKNIKPQKEIICYPVTVHQPQGSFADYKRSAPAFVIPTPPPIPPPSPPRRRSSRNNPTLRFVSTMKVTSEKSPVCKRHETCFTTSSNIDKSNVKYLKDKITCKLSPTLGRRSESPKMKVTKKITATPDIKGKITSSIITSKDNKTSSRKVQSKTNVHTSIGRSKSTESVRTHAKLSTVKKSPNSSVESLNLMKAAPKTFGSEKRKFDLNIKGSKLTKSPDLLSPTEVKKATMNLPSGTSSKKNNLPTFSKYGRSKEMLSSKVAEGDKSKSVSKTSAPPSPRLSKRSSPCPSTSSEKSKLIKSSQESLNSPKMSRREKYISKPSANIETGVKGDKAKKEQMNDEIKKDCSVSKSVTLSNNSRKGVVAKPKLEGNSDPKTTLSDIRQQINTVQSHYFFRHLLLGDSPPFPSDTCRKSWIVERTNQLARKSSFSEPSISAMKVYLKHTRPVTDSKFISLDMASVRSRSASPKYVSFNYGDESRATSTAKRSSSLPPKLVFSQTSRPISPLVQRKKIISPPPSPKLCRSPSCRKIMQIKHLQIEKKQPEYSLYMCPSLNHSTASMDSLKSEDYHKYNDYIQIGKKSGKFKDLNQFYSEIEKVGKLERSVSLKPRKKCENEIIDFDRWKEVRTRERAEQELGLLYNQIKADEKEKGFLYLPKDVARYRWKRELDRGLRIKEKSVEDIKEEFEKIKQEESDRENTKRRELAAMKDTYKPLWRGNSVVDIANTIIERRSHSEGRVKSARQRLLDSEKLLTHGIGSRIWSSLSMEQVNILKEQLAEIYNNVSKPKDECFIQVPKDNKLSYAPTLTVRRNSDSSEQMFRSPTQINSNMSEDDKKMISQSLSKELMQKLGRYRKENKKALPVVVGREILGAVAAAGAKVKNEQPVEALMKTTALVDGKVYSTSENESGSTDESTRTVICADKSDEIKKKVEYFEKAKEQEVYTPTIYKPAESCYDVVDISDFSQDDNKTETFGDKSKLFQSKSCQSLKEYFGEKDLVKFATIPLSATRKQKFTPKKPELRATDISPLRSEISATTSNDSLCRSRSISPYEKQSLTKTGEVSRLKHKFEYLEYLFGESTLKRSRSESDLHRVYPDINVGYVDSLRRKYEYPAYSGRGRSRTRRGGVVSPLFLRAEDRFMPHINIISKIASLYTKKVGKNEKESKKSIEQLAELLGCPVGEVEKLKEKYDSQEDISLVGHMYTSSPSIRELKDIAPYLTADWTAHRYPKLEDNTRSLSSPEHSVASRDTSLVRRDRPRPKSISPPPKANKATSILKPVHQKYRSADFSQNQKYDPKIHEPVARYQPNDVARYKNGWSVCSKPTVSFKGVVFRLRAHEMVVYRHRYR